MTAERTLIDTARRDKARRDRVAEINARDKSHGGLTPHDRADEIKARSMSGWGPYKAAATWADLDNGAEDRSAYLPITLARLMSDCRSAVARWAPKHWTKDQRGAAVTDAALAILRWDEHGGARDDQAPYIDLGGARERRRLISSARRSAPTEARAVLAYIDRADEMIARDCGTLPLRRDWYSAESRSARFERGAREACSAAALSTLRRAVDQVTRWGEIAREARIDEMIAPDENGEINLIAAAEAADDRPHRMPDCEAPAIISEFCDMPLDAARAVVADAFIGADLTALAEQWDVSRNRARNARDDGRAWIQSNYPNAADLLDALADGGARFRETVERGAILALIDYRDGLIDEDTARLAADEYNATRDGMHYARRALLTSARRANARNGAPYGSAAAERIAETVPRLLAAEVDWARRQAPATAPMPSSTREMFGYGAPVRIGAPRAERNWISDDIGDGATTIRDDDGAVCRWVLGTGADGRSIIGVKVLHGRADRAPARRLYLDPKKSDRARPGHDDRRSEKARADDERRLATAPVSVPRRPRKVSASGEVWRGARGAQAPAKAPLSPDTLDALRRARHELAARLEGARKDLPPCAERIAELRREIRSHGQV